MTDTLRVEMRFKNARLYQAICDHAVNDHHDTRGRAVFRSIGPVNAFCRQAGLWKTTVYRLLNLTLHPLGDTGKWRPTCVRLAALLECDIAWLFPLELYDAGLLPIAIETDHARLLSLRAIPQQTLALPPSQDDQVRARELHEALAPALQTLTPREAKIVQLRYGLIDGEEHTLESLAHTFKVSRGRIHSIEATALSKLRHPAVSRALVGHLA